MRFSLKQDKKVQFRCTWVSGLRSWDRFQQDIELFQWLQIWKWGAVDSSYCSPRDKWPRGDWWGRTSKAGNCSVFGRLKMIFESQVLCFQVENIATGETSPAITPYHTYHFSISTSLTFITSKLPSQDDFHHLITFTTR